MPSEIKEPWLSFLRDVDRALKGPVELHCLGGFVLSALWDLPRPTADVDFIEIRPSNASEGLLRVAGEEGVLAERYHLYFQRVTIASYPADYESRLIDMTPDGLNNLKLMALEVHDLVLAKLARNSEVDRNDVRFLANRGALDAVRLEQRFEDELRPYVLNPERERLTLDLWLDEFLREEPSSE